MRPLIVCAVLGGWYLAGAAVGQSLLLAPPLPRDGGAKGSGGNPWICQNVAVTVEKAGFDGRPCVKAEASGKDGFAKVDLPIPSVKNDGSGSAFYLLTYRVKIRNNAGFKVLWKTDRGQEGGSQEVGFMAWKDTDTSEWMNLRTGIPLAAGARIKELYGLVTCPSVGDAVWVGGGFVEKTDERSCAAASDPKTWDEIQNPSNVPTELLRGTKKGNLLRNSSFEVGSTFMDNPYQVYPGLTDKTAWDGVRSLTLNKSGWLGQRLIGTRDFRITPGRVYTFSFYARSERAGTRIVAGVFSGWQWSDRTGYLKEDKPSVSHAYTLDTQWTRYSFTFIPKYATKSCAKIFFDNSFDANPAESYVDGVQLEEGLLSDYQPDKPLDVGLGLDPKLDKDGGVCVLGQPMVYRLDIYSQRKGTVELEYIVTDYWGTQVERKTERVDVPGGRDVRKTVSFQPKEPGIYKVVAVFRDRVSGVTGRSEEYSFGVVPADASKTGSNEKSFFGTHIQIDDPFGLSAAAKAGVKWVRLHDGSPFISDWNSVEVEPGKFQYDKGDERVAELQKQGFVLLGRLGVSYAGLPKWVKRDAKIPSLPDVEPWRDYVSYTVSHYRGRINYWEVWNEPYFEFSPELYAQFLKIAYAEIKKANPQATVVGICGNLADSVRTAWFEDVLKLVGTDYMDVISHHGYLYNPYPELMSPSLETRLMMLQGWLQKYGKKQIPMWDTEFAVRSSPFTTDRIFGSDNQWVRMSPIPYDFQDGVNWLVRQHVISLALHHEKLFYYFMGSYEFGRAHDKDVPFCSLFDYTASPDPVFLAYAAMAWQIDNSRFVKEVKLGEKTKCYLFERDRKPIAVLWRVAGKNDRKVMDRLSIAAPGDQIKVLSVMGGPCRTTSVDNGQYTIRFSGEPVYIHGIGLTTSQLGQLLESGKIEGGEILRAGGYAVSEGSGKGSVRIRLVNVTREKQDYRIKVANVSGGWQIEGMEQPRSVEPLTDTTVTLPIGHFTDSGAATLGVYSLGTPWIPETELCRVAVEAKKTIQAREITRPIVLDGSFADWPSASPVMLDDVSLVKEGSRGWKGSKDLSSQVSAACDRENLYFAIRVTDQKISVDSTSDSGKRSGNRLWQGDCVEVFFYPAGSSQDRIFQYFAAPASSEQNLLAMGFCLQGKEASGIKAASKERPGGYDLEIKIPLVELGVTEVRNGLAIGFDVKLDDRDNGESRKSMIWSGTVDNYMKADRFGVLVLDADITGCEVAEKEALQESSDIREYDQAVQLFEKGKPFEAIARLKHLAEVYRGTALARKSQVKLAAVLDGFYPRKLEFQESGLARLQQETTQALLQTVEGRKADQEKNEKLAATCFVLGQRHFQAKQYQTAQDDFEHARDLYRELTQKDQHSRIYRRNYQRSVFLAGDAALQRAMMYFAQRTGGDLPYAMACSKIAEENFSVAMSMTAEADDTERGLAELAQWKKTLIPITDR